MGRRVVVGYGFFKAFIDPQETMIQLQTLEDEIKNSVRMYFGGENNGGSPNMNSSDKIYNVWWPCFVGFLVVISVIIIKSTI